MQHLIFGFVLRIGAIISKIAFLFLIVPKLNEGIFSTYFVILTSIVLTSRIISLGFDDHLPPLLVNKPWKIKKVGDIVLIFMFVSVLIFALSFYEEFLSIVALAVLLIATFLLAGVVRSLESVYYEILSTAPWMIFLLLSLITTDFTVYGLFFNLTLSYLVVNLLMLFYLREKLVGRRSNFGYVHKVIKKEVKSSFRKLLSSLLFTLNFRIFAIMSFFLFQGVTADKVAIIIAAAEAGYQLLIVFVNKSYTSQVKEKWNKVKVQGFYFFMVFLSVLGVGISLAFEYFNISLNALKLDWIMLAYFIVFVSYLVLITFVKYVYWSRKEEWPRMYYHQVLSILFSIGLFLVYEQLDDIFTLIAIYSSIAITIMYFTDIKFSKKVC
jgi:hypothetical protein